MSENNSQTPAWASFCISTYQRPAILREQLILLAHQTFPRFEVIISDNDPQASAREIVNALGDPRFKYYHNGTNLGMISSFNESIRRSSTDFVIMVTDDDPIQPEFLQVFYDLHQVYPGYSLYCGFFRSGKAESEVEQIDRENFPLEILDPDKTTNMLWSSCVMERNSVLESGMIPEFGSPHLADHALMARVGSIRGGVIKNQMYSSLTSHDTNYSKTNFESYVMGCGGFYQSMCEFFHGKGDFPRYHRVIIMHLNKWFIVNVFALKRYYATKRVDPVMQERVNQFAKDILSFKFMRSIRAWYFFKNIIFWGKMQLGLLSRY